MKYSVCEDIFANIMFELHIARVRVVRRFDSAYESRKKKKRGGGRRGEQLNSTSLVGDLLNRSQMISV